MVVKFKPYSALEHCQQYISNTWTDIKSNYRTIIRYWPLIHFMVVGQSRGDLFKTVLGDTWLLIGPLMQMLIYYFLIVVIFRSGASYGVNPFLLIMFGITHYSFFQQALTSSSTAILDREHILMQVNIEPLVFVAVAFLRNIKTFSIALVIYFIFYLSINFVFDPRIIFYPLIILIMMILSWSLCVMVSSLTVFFRDLSRITAILLNILMYFAPVVYTVEFVPANYRELYLYNPVSSLFALLHWSAFKTAFPPTITIFVLIAFTILMFFLSTFVYNKTKVEITKAL